MRRPGLLAAGHADDGSDVAEPGRRRSVLVATLLVGSALLAATLRVERDSDQFTVLALLAASTWILGAFASGRTPLRGAATEPLRAVVVPAFAVGVGAFLVFLVAYLIARQVPGLDGALESVLDKTDAGAWWVVLGVALVNGVAEEVFFRGALQSAISASRQVVVTTCIYALVTAATGNVALVVAAVVMGALFSLERRASGGILAPTITHLAWSSLMILWLLTRTPVTR